MDKLIINDVKPACLKEFLLYKSTIQNRSMNTIINYYSDIKLFFRFLLMQNNLVTKDIEFEEIIIDNISDDLIRNVTVLSAMEFFHYMSTERSNSATARSRRAVTLRQFYKYLTDKKMWFNVSPLEKLELPNVKKSLPIHLTAEQAIEILKSASPPNDDDYYAVRDYTIITLFLHCGMRLSELVNINVNDYSRAKDYSTETEYKIIQITGKGNKKRIVYLNSTCERVFDEYKQAREKLVSEHEKLKHEPALFLSRENNRISNRRVQQIIEKMLKDNNLDNMGFSVHKLRHTAATLMYQNGVDVRVLKEILGHEDLGTTQIYTHVAEYQLKKAIDKNPLNDINIEKK